MTAKGVDFAQHEKLLQRRAILEREAQSLRKTDQELEEVARKLTDARLQLAETHEHRLAARRERAGTLEVMDADVRLQVHGFRDREDFESRREQWFGGAGLQERDWDTICDHVFAQNGQVPERIRELVDALRIDSDETATRSAPLDAEASATAQLIVDGKLTKNFFNALVKRDRFRLDEMERFLPEDLVKALRFVLRTALSRRSRPARLERRAPPSSACCCRPGINQSSSTSLRTTSTISTSTTSS